jgi:hypothetical protein
MSARSVVDTGWQVGQSMAVAFEQHVEELAVVLTRVTRGDLIRPASGLAEEMGAVLEGRFALVCGDDTHELVAGDGILVPQCEARAWQLLSERGVLYRVWRHADVGP